MSLEQKPFVRYHEEKKYDHVTLKLNKEERLFIEQMKKELRQPKDSTAMKQLIQLGAEVVLRPEIRKYKDIIFNNMRKNKRLGITEYE